MNHFQFAGKNSRDFGLYITGQPFVSGERDIDEIAIPGRNGNLTVSNGRIENINVEYECFVRNKLPTRAREIKAWLLSAEPYQTLADSYDPDYFRQAYCPGPVDFEKIQRFGQGTITFRCKPLLYSWEGQRVITLEAAGTVFNPEAFPSRPYLRIYGTASTAAPATLYINSQAITFNLISSYTEIDSEAGIVYRGTVNQGGVTILASMPTLQSGNNAISWSGGITKIEIIPRWCTA